MKMIKGHTASRRRQLREENVMRMRSFAPEDLASAHLAAAVAASMHSIAATAHIPRVARMMTKQHVSTRIEAVMLSKRLLLLNAKLHGSGLGAWVIDMLSSRPRCQLSMHSAAATWTTWRDALLTRGHIEKIKRLTTTVALSPSKRGKLHLRAAAVKNAKSAFSPVGTSMLVRRWCILEHAPVLRQRPRRQSAMPSAVLPIRACTRLQQGLETLRQTMRYNFRTAW